MTVLVDGAPQVVALAMYGEKHRIQVPCVARSGTPAAQLVGIGLPELAAPIPDRLIGQEDAAFGHALFDVPGAQAEAEIEPDTVADDLGWESMALVRIRCWWCIHATTMPHEGRSAKGEVHLTMPARHIQAAAPIPVVYMSAQADAATVERLQAITQAAGFVPKPIHLPTLYATLQRACSRTA